MHSHRPMAYYPAYTTELLPSGEYIFASAVFFSTEKRSGSEPIIRIDGSRVNICFESITKELKI